MVGIAVGLAAGLALSRALDSMLDGLRLAEPRTIVETGVILIVTSLSACALPAARAVPIGPVVALRDA